MTRSFAPLQGVRILSLALNLPGPAALMRCRRMGASCTKIEPPSGDAMGQYNAGAYAELHEGVKVLQADLKSTEGQQVLQRELPWGQGLRGREPERAPVRMHLQQTVRPPGQRGVFSYMPFPVRKLNKQGSEAMHESAPLHPQRYQRQAR